MSTKHSYFRFNGDRKEYNFYRSRSKNEKTPSPHLNYHQNQSNFHKEQNSKTYGSSKKYNVYKESSEHRYRNYKTHKIHKNHRKEERRRHWDEKSHHKYKTHHHHYEKKHDEKKHKDNHEEDRKKKKSIDYEKKKRSEEKINVKEEEKISSEDGKDRTKDEGHYKYEIGEVILNKFKILKHLADGTFGRVLEVINLNDNRMYAMKIIRAVDRYVESAKTEVEILLDMKRKDPDNKSQIVKLVDAFEYKKNYCMVFEKLGLSLYELLKKNDYRGYSIDLIQSFFKQILTSIGFMHANGLTHTDLKPENILLVSDEYETLDYRDIKEKVDFSHNYCMDDDRSSTCSKTEKKEYFIPKNDLVKIIDFGGATYENEHHSSIINTRQYRAPEIILSCCDWEHSSDIWCIACIILELYSGELLFETHESYEHLAMIEKMSGHIPYWMCYGVEGPLAKHFDFSEEHYKKYKTYFDWPKYAKDKESYSRVKNMRVVKDIISKEHKELADLLMKMLNIDPSKRIDCETALNHPFFSIKYKKIK